MGVGDVGGLLVGHQGVSGVYWGLAGTVDSQGPEGVYGHQGALGVPRGIGAILGVSDFRGCRGCWGVLGAGRDSRYSGAKRDIGGLLRGHQGV